MIIRLIIVFILSIVGVFVLSILKADHKVQNESYTFKAEFAYNLYTSCVSFGLIIMWFLFLSTVISDRIIRKNEDIQDENAKTTKTIAALADKVDTYASINEKNKEVMNSNIDTIVINGEIFELKKVS